MGRIAILLLEDSPIDEELIRARLRKEAFEFVMDRVDTALAFQQALASRPLDLILADHSLPGYDGVAALGVARVMRPEIPFLFVSATLGEEVAIECLKRGATDYVLKQRLDRLGPAIRRALDEAHERAERVAAQEALAARSVQLHRLAEVSTRLNAALDVETVLRLITEEARELLDVEEAVTSLTPDSNRLTITPQMANARHPRAARRTATLPETVALNSLLTLANRPVRLTRQDLVEHPATAHLAAGATDALPARGWLAAALVGRNGRRLGVIQLADKLDGGFTADDEYFLVQLAQMAAGAIENARLYEELRANDRRKDEFLAMLAHELRNPLAAVNNAVSVLRMSTDEEGRRWASEVVERQFRQLARLIDDLLDVSRITSGKIRLKRERIDVARVIEAAIESAGPIVDQKRHKLIVQADRGAHFVDADPVRLEQVFVNLLTNAAKYTEPQGTIWLSTAREDSHVVVRVRDTGMGIPAEQLSRMFDLFAQGERSIARSEGGLGIGLTIVRSLVEMHGGQIAAISGGAGAGSEFIVTLPATEPAPGPGPAPAPQPTARESMPGCPSRILVVDDNVDMARGLARLLGLLGHDVRTAYDGGDALAVIEAFSPEFVLMDIGLPGMDGYEVVRRLRNDPRRQGVVVIAISGYGQKDDRRRSREAGFDHHLVKPVDHDLLSALLARNGRRPARG